MIRTVIAGALYALALFVFFTGILGMFRFRYVLNRMHAVALGDTLGILLVVAGTIVLRGVSLASVKLALIPAFMFLTGPAATHLIAGAEVRGGASGREYEREDRR